MYYMYTCIHVKEPNASSLDRSLQSHMTQGPWLSLLLCLIATGQNGLGAQPLIFKSLTGRKGLGCTNPKPKHAGVVTSQAQVTQLRFLLLVFSKKATSKHPPIFATKALLTLTQIPSIRRIK